MYLPLFWNLFIKLPCILGLSGGVDSAYMLYLANKLGLRVLAVHVDSGWNSEMAVSNIEKMCQKLDRRMKSEKGIDSVGELKLLLMQLGASR